MTRLFWVAVSFLFFNLSAVEAKRWDLNDSIGHKNHAFQSPGGMTESCVITEKLPLGDYRGRLTADKVSGDFKKEQQLCALSFYQEQAVCPKQWSTNPAVEIYKMKGTLAARSWERSNCGKSSRKRDKSTSSKLAKFKQSVTCSYAPSALAYYHIGRSLGIGNIPVAVLRSMDLSEHSRLARQGLSVAQRLRSSSMKSAWSTLVHMNKNAHRKGYKKGQTKTDNLYTKDSQQIWGALIANSKGEAYHPVLNGSGPRGYQNRFKRLVRSSAFRDMSRTSSFQSLLNGRSPKNIQKLQYIKDMSDMLLIDFLLNQQDRPGNIHVQTFLYKQKEDGSFSKKRLKNKKANGETKRFKDYSSQEIAAYKAQNQFVVDEMLLKDNDCGVQKTNYTQRIRPNGSESGGRYKDGGLLSAIRHMSPDTYQKLLKLEQYIDQSQAAQYFQKELLFDRSDFSGGRHQWFGGLKANVKAAARILKAACRSGKLKLDIDLMAAMKGVPSDASCSLR